MNDAAAAVAPEISGHYSFGNGNLAEPLYSPTCKLLTPSLAMRSVLDLVAKIAPTASAVLLRGESGVGKETIAREIHRKSGRAQRALVRVPCGAICHAHLDAQLFGRDGYRLPADEADCPSLVARSDRGTLFLKDVSELPFWAQVKLLDVLQQGEREPPQDGPAAPPDIRVIASSTCDLEAAMAEGRFHAGLYYYLNIVEIRIPPLRERREDIRPLAESFLARMHGGPGLRAGGAGYRFCEEAWQRLLEYDWPGNARELASVVAHAATVSDSSEIGADRVTVSLSQVRCQRHGETISVPLVGGLKAIERCVVGAVIERCRGNKAKAARLLGLHRRTLYRLLQEKVYNGGQPNGKAAGWSEDR